MASYQGDVMAEYEFQKFFNITIRQSKFIILLFPGEVGEFPGEVDSRGFPGEVDSLGKWVPWGCGYPGKWVPWGCGFPGDVGSLGMWIPWGCGFPGDVDSLGMWVPWGCGFLGDWGFATPYIWLR
jgi:hypothetical protein